MDRRWWAVIVAGSILSLGCAPGPGELEPLPRHPFPRWVSKLDLGESDIGSVQERFGEPDEVEQSVRGGLVFRYRFAEVRWPADDPDRPVVGANGKPGPRTKSDFEDIGDTIAGFGEWLDWLMFYPPKQPRPVAPRWLPATIHDLELDFDLEGKLVRYRYVPQEGRAPVPRNGV